MYVIYTNIESEVRSEQILHCILGIYIFVILRVCMCIV